MPGTIIGQVTAFDQDKKVLSSFYVDSLRKDIFLFQDPNNRIRYRLVSAGGLEQHFSVNPETGLITLALQVDAFAGEKITVSCKCIKTLGRYIETPGSEGRTFCSISTKYETGKFLRMGKFFLVQRRLFLALNHIFQHRRKNSLCRKCSAQDKFRNFQLRIEASDSGVPAQSSMTTVLIDVVPTASQVSESFSLWLYLLH